MLRKKGTGLFGIGLVGNKRIESPYKVFHREITKYNPYTVPIKYIPLLLDNFADPLRRCLARSPFSRREEGHDGACGAVICTRDYIP